MSFYVKLSIIFLLLTAPTLAVQGGKSYTAEELTPQLINQQESEDEHLEMFPTTYQDSITPDDLADVDPYFGRRPRRPDPRPWPEEPNRPNDPETSPDRSEFPVLNRLWKFILNMPIVREISALIYKFATILTWLAIWLLPVYLFRYRLVWPLDVVTKALDWFREMSKNDRKPFE